MRDWPLNVFTTRDEAELLPIMRAIVTGDLHNTTWSSRRTTRSFLPSENQRPSDRRALHDISIAGRAAWW